MREQGLFGISIPVEYGGLGGRDRLSMIYLEVCRGAHTAAFSLEAGARVPIHRSAMGYAYLWALPVAAFKALERTGFCVAEGIYERSINGVGAALVLQNGTEVHALSCSGPAFQLAVRHLQDEIGPRLLAMLAAIREDVSRQTRDF